MTSRRSSSGAQLHRWQDDFVSAALELHRPATVLLEAATGAGVLRALAALAEGVMKRQRGRARILLLTPDSLVDNAVGALDRYGSVPPVALDGTLYRELQVRANEPYEMWPRGVVLVGGNRSARRPSRHKAIKKSDWDLVIVDQAWTWGEGLGFLIGGANMGLVVLVGSSRDYVKFDGLRRGELIRWDLSRLDATTAESVAARRASMAVAGFRRSEPEKKLLADLGALTGSFSDHPGEWLDADLIAAAIASPQALEARLLDLEASLSAAARSAGPDADMIDISLPASFEPHREVEIIEPISAIRAQITALLNGLYAIPDDPKCTALKKLLVRLWRNADAPTLVLAAEPVTAIYIAETLGTTERLVHIDTRLTATERMDQLVRPGLRVAIASDSAVIGFELPKGWRIINYDLPRTEEAMDARWHLLPEFGSEVMWALVDLEHSVRLEGDLLVLHGF